MDSFDKNIAAKDHFEVISETIRSTVFSYIPAGPVFDAFWNYRSKLKQKRVLDFSESVKKALEQIEGSEIDTENFQSDDFIDLMELVYSKVMTTRSSYKLERFRNILVKQIVKPLEQPPLFNKYINLLDQLDDIQIIMLRDIRPVESKKIDSFIVAFMGIEGPKQPDSHIVDRFQFETGRLLTKGELEFFGNELISLGLVRNHSSITTNLGGSSTNYKIQISPFGKEFLDFIAFQDLDTAT